MARKVTITVTNHDTGCAAYYIMQYKLPGDIGWITMPNQLTDTIEISGLLDDTVYDYQITRICCDGQISNPDTGTFDTTL